LGGGRPATGGVRVLGEDHTVINNYFQDLTGSAGYSAIVLMQGLPDSPLNGYFQVQNAVIAFNTVANCAHSLLVGLEATYSQSGSNLFTSLPPLNCTIANNLVFATQNELVDQRATPIHLTWQGNIMFGTALGILPTPGVLIADPRLSPGEDGLWRPAADGPAFAAAQGSYGYVTDDIRGRLRPTAKDLGCVEVNPSPPTRSPVTSADVGPDWLHPLTLTLTLRSPTLASLRWRSVSGAVYQVQSSTNLGPWTNASSAITTIGATQIWEESLGSTTGRVPATKSYRLKQLIHDGPLRPVGSPDGSGP
jgi:hypothetical protein